MPNTTQEQIDKLIGFFATEKIMSKEDMDELLQALVKILAENKKGVEGLSLEIKEEVKRAVQQIADDHNSVLNQVGEHSKATRAEIEKAVKEQNGRAFKQLQDLINKTKFPKDGAPGKDADPEAITNEVLARIKLPENKVITGEDITAHLSTLAEEEKDKLFTLLGSKKLKGLEDTMEARFADALNRVRLTRGVKSIIAGTNITVETDGDGNVTVSSTGGGSASAFTDLTDTPSDYTGHAQKFVKVTAGEDGLEFVAGSGVSTEWGDIVGTLSDQTDLQTALDGKSDTTHDHDADYAAISHTHTASQVTDFDTEVSNNTDVAANTAARHAAVTVADSSEIDFTLTGQQISASLIAGSIDESKLDTSVNASLDLADSAVQDLSDLSITATASELNALDGITATVTELNYTDGVTSNIQTQLNGKIDAITSTDNAVPRFNSTGGAVQDSGVLIDDSDNITMGGLLKINRATGNPEFDFQENGTTRAKVYYDVTDNQIVFQNNENNSANAIRFSDSAVFDGNIQPNTSDGASLGTTALMWSDLFLASGSVINFNNGDVTLTHSSNTLTLDGGTLAVGNNPVSTSGEIQMDGTPNSDHSAVGPTTSTFSAGTTVTAMDLVYLASDGEWALADADAVSTSAGMLAIALAAGTDGNSMKVALPGSFVRDDTWNWTPGATLYVSTTAGAITATAPNGTDDVVRVVGFAVTADVIYFSPSPDHITHV